MSFTDYSKEDDHDLFTLPGFHGIRPLSGPRGAFGEMWTTSFQCMNYGRVYDSVIEQHQLACQGKILALLSGEPDYQDDNVHLEAESFIGLAA